MLSDPLYREVARTTVQIATIAMLVQLAIAVPIAYVLAFKAGKWELPLLLFLVLADELNPMVRIYAWRMLLGREGLINEALQRIGLIDQPIDALLFSKFAVIVVLSTSYLTYTVIPIYACDEGGRPQPVRGRARPRRRLVDDRPPGPAAADRARASSSPCCSSTSRCSPTSPARPWSAAPAATCSARSVNDLVLESGDLNGGAAMSLLMLIASGIFAVVAYRLAKIRQLES